MVANSFGLTANLGRKTSLGPSLAQPTSKDMRVNAVRWPCGPVGVHNQAITHVDCSRSPTCLEGVHVPVFQPVLKGNEHVTITEAAAKSDQCKTGAQRSLATSRRVDPFLAMDVLKAANARERDGKATYHLEVGQPGAPVAPAIRRAAARMLDAGQVGYTEASGLAHLRARIATHYLDRYGLSVDPGRVVVTTGSSAAFSLAFLLLCEPGERVGLPRPGYPAYRNIVRALGLEPVEIPLDAEGDWLLTGEGVARHHEKTPMKCILMASPNNPTGSVTSGTVLANLARTCRREGIWLISDEIYHGLIYDGDEVCALGEDNDAIIINSFSKYYGMTGWRIGWMIMPERMVRPAEALAQNLFICPPALAQTAAVAAFDATTDLEATKRSYARNRLRLLQTAERLKLGGGPTPDGAFYCYWPIQTLLHPGETAGMFCRRLLADTGVAITPGDDFDPVRGHEWVRVSYAGNEADVATAADLFEAWATDRPKP